VFERFTDRSRRVLVLAQEEARRLDHGFIGTEHLLLGLIHEGEGLAGVTLDALGITLEAVRERVAEVVDGTGATQSGAPPFTARTKRVLELSLQEALQLGTSYIDTEHLLLALIEEGDGVAVEVLISLGVVLHELRQRILAAVSGRPSRVLGQAEVRRASSKGVVGFMSSSKPDADFIWMPDLIAIVKRLDSIVDRLARIERRLGVEPDEDAPAP
jgi:ATP-dependent Clp protease ATP-binding subunit ClpC